MARVSALLGPVPRVEPKVSDDTGALNPQDHRRLYERVKQVEKRFPQIRLQVVCHAFPMDHPFDLYTFWLFNLGAISPDNERAGDNHTILLTLDPVTHRSSIIVGYGLEPFLRDDALDGLLGLAEPAWQKLAWADGLLATLDGLERLLERTASSSQRSFDLASEDSEPVERAAADF